LRSILSARQRLMIYVVATIEVQPGKREEFLALQKSLLPLVRAEQGCLEYVSSVDLPLNPEKNPPRGDVIVMQEKWETLDHLKANAGAPNMNDFRTKSKALVKSTKVEVFEPVQ